MSRLKLGIQQLSDHEQEKSFLFSKQKVTYCCLEIIHSGAIVPCNRHLQEERFFCPTLIEFADNCLASTTVVRLYKRYLESKPICF